jgi:hypothetical protein
LQDESDDDEDDTFYDDSIDDLQASVGRMEVASPNGRRRARRDPRIVQPMMPAIPPVDYPVPGAGRGVTLDIILFSGTTRDDLQMMVLP